MQITKPHNVILLWEIISSLRYKITSWLFQWQKLLPMAINLIGTLNNIQVAYSFFFIPNVCLLQTFRCFSYIFTNGFFSLSTFWRYFQTKHIVQKLLTGSWKTLESILRLLYPQRKPDEVKKTHKSYLMISKSTGKSKEKRRNRSRRNRVNWENVQKFIVFNEKRNFQDLDQNQTTSLALVWKEMICFHHIKCEIVCFECVFLCSKQVLNNNIFFYVMNFFVI